MAKGKLLLGQPRGRFPLAPEGWPFLAAAFLLLLVSMALSWNWLSTVLFVLLAFMLNFFRDPERKVPAEPGLYLAPADGKVLQAAAGEDGCRVDIFMNIFNVHVNRAPMSGRIVHMQYFPGQFINASFDKASQDNERNRIEINGDKDPIAITQIAGLVARRIVSYIAVGDHVEAGQRIGMIRFGSRVNCEIPEGFELAVHAGQAVKAGETVLARKSHHG